MGRGDIAAYTKAIMTALRESGRVELVCSTISTSVARSRIYNAASRAGLRVTTRICRPTIGDHYVVGRTMEE